MKIFFSDLVPLEIFTIRIYPALLAIPSILLLELAFILNHHYPFLWAYEELMAFLLRVHLN